MKLRGSFSDFSIRAYTTRILPSPLTAATSLKIPHLTAVLRFLHLPDYATSVKYV